MQFKSYGRSVFYLFVSFCLFACAPKQEINKRYFWPPLTDEPKIEYIGFLQSDYDVKKKNISALEEAILGREIPRFLFNYPQGVVSNDEGLVYVTEPNARVVHVIDLESSSLNYLQDEKGVSYSFVQPMGVDVDAQGNVYIADSLASEVLVFGKDNKFDRKWKGDHFGRPVSLAVDDERGRVYVVDAGRHKVLVLSLEDGRLLTEIGERGLEPGQFNYPLDIDIDQPGHVYVLDAINARIQKFSGDGVFLSAFGERGTEVGSFQLPKGLAVDVYGHVYVTDSRGHKIIVFGQDGSFLMTVGGEHHASDSVVPGGMYMPQGVDVDSRGRIFVVDTLNRMVHQFQYLTNEYLHENPVLPGQAVNPFVDE